MQIQLNLASRPYYNRRAVRFWLLATGLFLVLMLILNLVFGYQNYRQYQQVGRHLAELDTRLMDVQGYVPEKFSSDDYDLTLEQVAELNRVLEADQFRWTSLLNRLEELVPDNVSINSIQPDFSSRSLRVQAVSRDVQGMTDFLDALLASPDLNQAFLQQHRELKDQSKGGRSAADIGFSLEIREAF